MGFFWQHSGLGKTGEYAGRLLADRDDECHFTAELKFLAFVTHFVPGAIKAISKMTWHSSCRRLCIVRI